MISKKIARRYTLAVYEIALQDKIIDKILQDFMLIRNTAKSSREFMLMLRSPVINSKKKLAVLEALFGKAVNTLTMKLIAILCEKNRESSLYDISVDFETLVNEKKGLAKAKVTTAIELTDKEKNNIISRLKQYTGKELIPNFTVDKNIKGGFIAQVSDTIIDASIKRQLELLREEFGKGSTVLN
jgi:F-type H+-transporting ATPase subunit delta